VEPTQDERPARRRGLAFDLTALAVVGVLLIGAGVATVGSLYRSLYSPSAFVADYLDLLAAGRAADALLVPGVAVDSVDLEAAGLPTTASEALLRRDALAPLSDVEVVKEVEEDGIHYVTVSYTAGTYESTTTFQVERLGQIGPAPTWTFAQSPLAVIELGVSGSMQFSVNGFQIDKRQVSPDGADADPLAPVPMLAFSPGFYSISVDTPAMQSPGVAVVSDRPQAKVPVGFQAEPTAQFMDVVQRNVETFLAECATQQVLQPTGCPFGFYVRNRIVAPPEWSITTQPVVTLVPDGAGWAIERTQAVAHIDVDIRSIFDGSVTRLSEDVPFFLRGSVTILPDDTVSIAVAPSD